MRTPRRGIPDRGKGGALIRKPQRGSTSRSSGCDTVAAAGRINVPALIIHGDNDKETPHAHSLRIFAALREPKRLILVPNRGHGDSLTTEVWRDIDTWLEATTATEAPTK